MDVGDQKVQEVELKIGVHVTESLHTSSFFRHENEVNLLFTLHNNTHLQQPHVAVMSLNSYLNSECTSHCEIPSFERSCSKLCSSNSANTTPLLEKVCLILVDGRCMVGNLICCDHVTNLALENCTERVIRSPDEDEPSLEEERGLFMVRGDNVVVCGLVDEELDGSIDWTKVKGAEIGSTKHV